MSRKIARESLYKLIFEFLFRGINDYTFELLMLDKELDDVDRVYIDTVYRGVVERFEELKAIISEFAIGYTFDRIVKADKAALLLSIYELKYMPDIPPSASINEAVDLVKRYSTEKSSSFVNGILASALIKIQGDKNGNKDMR
ncbi:MAG: transcription antitermination factor NusB [Christensenellales bacterium]|jgi:N utilization substance protein B